jgi:hypothetical protein
MKEATDAENPKVTRNVGPKSRKTAHRNHRTLKTSKTAKIKVI